VRAFSMTTDDLSFLSPFNPKSSAAHRHVRA
jgi:hypothetical protein